MFFPYQIIYQFFAKSFLSLFAQLLFTVASFRKTKFYLFSLDLIVVAGKMEKMIWRIYHIYRFVFLNLAHLIKTSTNLSRKGKCCTCFLWHVMLPCSHVHGKVGWIRTPELIEFSTSKVVILIIFCKLSESRLFFSHIVVTSALHT